MIEVPFLGPNNPQGCNANGPRSGRGWRRKVIVDKGFFSARLYAPILQPCNFATRFENFQVNSPWRANGDSNSDEDWVRIGPLTPRPQPKGSSACRPSTK
jgi:hypothetical protein